MLGEKALRPPDVVEDGSGTCRRPRPRFTPDVVDGQWVTVLRRGRFGAIIEAADTSALAASVPAGVLA